jgi:O-antigen/teichoic acid export membrane protein
MRSTSTDASSSGPAGSTRQMDRSLAVGVAWTASAKWSSQFISWASFLVVTRLLAPSDMGLVGMAVLLCGLLQVVTDAFGTAVATLRHLTGEQLAQLNTVALLSGFLGCLISCSLAIPLGWFFRSPHLPLVVIVLSTTFVIVGFQTVPYGLLYRDMRFRLLSYFAAIQSVTQALTTLALAWLGFRYWALALGNVVGATVLAGLQISWRPCRFARPRFDSMKEALTFSRHIMVSSVSWYGYSNADFLVAGRVLGQSALGAYTLAWNLATIPLEKVTAIVSNVAYAYFSAAQNDIVALRRYLRILTEGLSLITFPATIGMALVAGDFVHLFLGTKWQSAIVPLEILASYASFRCIVTLLPSILNVTGEPRFVMRNTQAALVLMPVAFYLGSRWGLAGIAYGWVLAYPIVAIALYRRTFRRIQMPWRDYLEAIRPAVSSSLVMVAAVEILKRALAPGFPLIVHFATEVLTGGSAYILALMVFHRERLSVFWNFLKTLRDPVRVNTSAGEKFPV